MQKFTESKMSAKYMIWFISKLFYAYVVFLSLEHQICPALLFIRMLE